MLSTHEQSLQQVVQKARAGRTTLPGKNADRGVDLAGAYQIQAATGRDRPLKGFKFGLISAAKQEQMGISTPLYGCIYADMIRSSPVALSDFIQPRLEPEIAIQLERDIAPNALPGDTQRAIGGFVLGIDILDSIWANYKFTAPEVVALAPWAASTDAAPAALTWLLPYTLVRRLAVAATMVWLALAPTWNCCVPKAPSSSLVPLNSVVCEIRSSSEINWPTSACKAWRSLALLVALAD